MRVTRRRDPRSADSESLAVSLQPRLDLKLSDRLDLGTELIVRHADDPVLVTVGGRLASSLDLGDLTVDGWLKPLFDTDAQQPERNRQRHIHDRWVWSVRYPVVRLSFGGGDCRQPGYLHINLSAQLDRIEVQNGVIPRYETAPERLGYLIGSLHQLTGQRVAVLVDEYDNPILDALEEPEVARANRDFLRGLYGVIEDSDAHVGSRSSPASASFPRSICFRIEQPHRHHPGSCLLVDLRLHGG